MRRADREILDENRIEQVIAGCQSLHLGLFDRAADEVYVVPLSFGYEKENGRYVFWFHGASEGRKLELIRQNGKAGFEMERGAVLKGGEMGCDWTTSFESVIGTGSIAPVQTEQEKRHGLQVIMRHLTGKADWQFREDYVQSVCVFRLEAEKLSCKIHL